MFRALFSILFLFVLAWGVFHFYEGGQIPFVGGTVGDAKTTASVKAALALHKELSKRTISVRTRDAIVLLTGEVASVTEKKVAGELVRNVPDVEGLDNLLAVTPELATEAAGQDRSLGQKLDDTALTAKVRGAFALHKHLKDLDISVRVREATVLLDGVVQTRNQMELARAWAQQVDGVQQVESFLEVKEEGQTGQTIEQLAERVESILMQNDNLASYRLRASAVGGNVVLDGEVETSAERELAELLAERITGQDRLRNRIEVKPR